MILYQRGLMFQESANYMFLHCLRQTNTYITLDSMLKGTCFGVSYRFLITAYSPPARPTAILAIVTRRLRRNPDTNMRNP